MISSTRQPALTRRVLLGQALGLLALTACSRGPAPDQGREGTQMTPLAAPLTVRYGPGLSQVADLHLPARTIDTAPIDTAEPAIWGRRSGAGMDAPNRIPVVVVVHGGFWKSGYDRSLGTPLAEDLAGHGVAAWNIEYRRVGEGPGGGGGWPTTFLDVAAAVDALAGPGQEAAGGLLDLDRVAVVGHSAGGHLAVWVAGRARLPAGAPGADPQVRVRGAVSQAGVLDLERAAELGLGGGAVDALLAGASEDPEQRWALASPYALLPLGVPVTVVHGLDDDVVPVQANDRFVRRSREAGDRLTEVRLRGVDHFAVIDPTHDAWGRCRDAALAMVRS